MTRERLPDLDPARTTVHDALGVHPAVLEVLNRHGIDVCCGGELSLAEAARRHGVELRRLLREIATVCARG